MDLLPRGGGRAPRRLPVRAAARGQRPAHERAGPRAGPRDPRRNAAPQPARACRLELVRNRLHALLARRPLHLQLPAPAGPRGAVPVARRRGVPARVPRARCRPRAPRTPPRARRRPRQRDRRGDHDRRPCAPVVDLADGPVPPRRHALDSRPLRVRRVPARRRAAARGRGAARARRRPATAGVPPDLREHHLPARDGLRVRADDPARDLRPSALARRRLDRLLPALGRRGVAPLDVGDRRAGRQARGGAHPLPARAADGGVPDRSDDRDGPRSVGRRLRLRRRARRVDHAVRARDPAHGGADAPAGALARARAHAERLRHRSGRGHEP